MSIEIKNFDSVKEGMEKLSGQIFDKEIQNKIANFFMTRVKDRTSKGYDVHGQAFKEYSPQYALFRHEKGLPTYIVDLFFSGSMMSSMTYEITNDTIRLFFQPTKDRKGVSNSSKAYWLHQDREFFALSLDDIAEARNLYKEYIEGVI